MMSYTTSAAWSRPISSPCYTGHGQRCGAVLSGRITTIVVSRSGQLCMRYSVEPNCSDMSGSLADDSVTHNCALDICEPRCVPGAARSFFIPVIHSPLGPWGTWQHRSSPLGEARSGHVAAPEPTRQGGEVQSRGTRGSVGALLSKETRPGATWHVAVSELTSARR
jgi:hypothetical protein